MNTLKYNQFQEIYDLDSVYCLVDFLKNEIKTFNKSQNTPAYEYSPQYDAASNHLDQILDKKKLSTLHITVITDFSCNMRCCYCYEGILTPSSGKTDVSSIHNFIKTKLTETGATGIAVSILGGEPLLPHNIEYLDELIKQIRDIDPFSTFTIITNGLNAGRYASCIKDWGIEYLQITLDGPEEIQNTRRSPLADVNGFKQITENISTLLQLGVSLELRVNVDRNNVIALPELAKFIIEQGWMNFCFSTYLYPVTKSGCSSYHVLDSEETIFKLVLDEFQNQSQEIKSVFTYDFHGVDYIDSLLNGTRPSIRPYFCGVSDQYVISNDGHIYTCWWGLDHDEFCLGNIYDTQNNLNQDVRNTFLNRSITKISRCKTCKYKYICGGGCAYTEWYKHGSLDQGNCANFDVIFQLYLKYCKENGKL